VADFDCATAERSAELEAAHNDPNVEAAAVSFLRAPERGMVKVLRISMYNYLAPARQRSMILSNGLDNAKHPFAYEMIAATNAICQMDPGTQEVPGPRRYARGAVIEKIADALLREREPSLLTEQCIGPLEGSGWRNGMSDPIDFYVPQEPHEFWDAKSNVWKIRGEHINALNQLLGIAGPTAMAGFITLWEREVVADSLSEFTNFEKPLYAYTFENFEQMSYGRPLGRVDVHA
jgi:hypothetical protein